jgi:surface antigen
MGRLRVAVIAVVTLTIVPVPAPADPPPWAPAHGWRKKNDPNYVGYTGSKWPQDYGVLDGRCDAAKVGAVVGGVVGGAIGSQVAKDSPNRPVAIVVGTVIGAVIGHRIGAEVDGGDLGCMGHALELSAEQKPVRWTNPKTGVDYVLTPTRNFNDRANPCREFSALASRNGGEDEHKGKGKGWSKGRARHADATFHGVACRGASGEWAVRL